MYDVTDPRAALTSSAAAPVSLSSTFFDADYAKFYETPPQDITPDARTWYVRGQNFVIAYTKAQPGAVLSRPLQADEYIVIAPDATTRMQVTTPAETVSVEGYSLVVIPPGESNVVLPQGGTIFRLFSARALDLLERCSNAQSYQVPHGNVAALQAWPEPVGGYRVRPYSLDVPVEPGRFGRIWRCTTFMVNYGNPRVGQRDITKMSPHSHPDFEQCSLAVTGEFVHHVRWPWITDMSKWMADQHEYCASPSVAIIPPPSIHTSEAKGDGSNQLVDIFCPPRLDFALKPGWVLNEADYPLPPG